MSKGEAESERSMRGGIVKAREDLLRDVGEGEANARTGAHCYSSGVAASCGVKAGRYGEVPLGGPGRGFGGPQCVLIRDLGLLDGDRIGRRAAEVVKRR
jgi:hypothetical protein